MEHSDDVPPDRASRWARAPRHEADHQPEQDPGWRYDREQGEQGEQGGVAGTAAGACGHCVAEHRGGVEARRGRGRTQPLDEELLDDRVGERAAAVDGRAEVARGPVLRSREAPRVATVARLDGRMVVAGETAGGRAVDGGVGTGCVGAGRTTVRGAVTGGVATGGAGACVGVVAVGVRG